MRIGQRNDPIETFTAQCSDEPFAQRVGLGAVYRCPDGGKTQVRHRSIEFGGKDRVAVMNDKTVRMVRGDGLTHLLEGPGCAWMGGDVGVNHAA